MFPANLVQATFQQVSSNTESIDFCYPLIFNLNCNASLYYLLLSIYFNTFAKRIKLICCRVRMQTRMSVFHYHVRVWYVTFTVLCFGFKYRTQRVAELIPKPTVAQLLDETTTRRVYIYGIQDDNGTDTQNFSLDLTPPPDVIVKTSPGTSEGMNVLGIVIFSATMGGCLT